MGLCGSKTTVQSNVVKKITIAVLGLENAGKTLTSKSLSGDQNKDVDPSMGFSNFHFNYKNLPITLYDLGGSKKIRSIWKNYFYDVHGVLYIVDATDENRIDESNAIFSELVCNPALSGKPFLVLANKNDLKDAFERDEMIEIFDLYELSLKYQTPSRLECVSAMHYFDEKEKGPIKESFKWLIDAIVANYINLQTRVESDIDARKKVLKDTRLKKKFKHEKQYSTDEEQKFKKNKQPSIANRRNNRIEPLNIPPKENAKYDHFTYDWESD
ncbi:ADP-ribosylation factor-like protein 13A [Intoshia linei]|uniref:ADP-ribosylation factor-like protein 13A n=1 Tax=Intoshia linei TaxID=1819745 RepID=A0A177AZ07_9BILA|nr:ADP-ribosylation factor-like protein 13A [Intoshia linei]